MADYSFRVTLVSDINPGGTIRVLRNGTVKVYNAATDALIFNVETDQNGSATFTTTDVVTVYLVSPNGLTSEHITAASAIEASAAFTVSEDTAVAALVADSGSNTGVAGDARWASKTTPPAAYASSSKRPINVSERFGRDDTSVRAAFTAAVSEGRPLYFDGDGVFAVTGDLTLTSPLDIRGDGYMSRINFTDGGLIVDGTAGFLMRPNLSGLRIARTGTAGPALHMKGAGNGTGVARVTASNLHLSAAGGTGLLYEGSYIGTFTGCYFESSLYGIRGILDTTTSTVGANALVFIGGESYGNTNGWAFNTPNGVAFYGFCTEGNFGSGGKITGVARGFVYHGGYFEGNQGPDIEVDCNAGSGGILIEGNAFFCVGMTKTEAVLLRRGRVGINNNHFNGLVEADGDVAIRVNEGTSPVSGEARNNMRGDDGTIVAYTAGGAAFNVTQLGQITKAGNTALSSTLNEQAGVSFVRKVSQALDFPSIAANSEQTLTVTVTGALVGDDCSVSSSMLESGLSVSSWGVTAADTVSIRLRNNTASAIDPTARTWRVRVWR